MGITPIIEWISAHCGKRYAPNTRETIRRKSVHQFMEAGLVVYNGDAPGRAVNTQGGLPAQPGGGDAAAGLWRGELGGGVAHVSGREAGACRPVRG